MNKPTSTLQIEPRWPVALTVMVVMWLLRVLPDRIRPLPIWFQYLFGITLLAAMLAVRVMEAKPLWLRVERLVLLAFCIVAGVLMLGNLAYLVREMVHHSTDLTGLQLLTSGIGVWVVNVFIFSFTAATAFSPTDTLPLTARAKLAMMFESSVSLMTLVVVGARAINILGS